MGTTINVSPTGMEGAHRITRIKRLAAEWNPKEAGAIRFRDQIINELERLSNGYPDFDSGYFLVEKGSNGYVLQHGLGRIPTRYAIFLSYTPAPEEGYTVTHIASGSVATGSGNVGIELIHNTDGLKTLVYIRAWKAYFNLDSAYIRVLFWR